MTETTTASLTSARVLVVDDEDTNLLLLKRILNRTGYEEVLTLSRGDNLLPAVDEFNPDLVLLDLHMPAPDGFALLSALGPRINGPERLSVLVLTGDDSAESKRRALSLGARDFLAKPFDSTEALLRIRNLIETSFLHRALANQNANLESRVTERTSELQQSQNETLERLARASEIRDDETGRHTQRVGELSWSIAKALDLGTHIADLVRKAAPLHDVGKIGIPDSILLKPGTLTPEEMSVMRTHTTIGAKILSGGMSEVMIMAEQIALNHHERWDGDGYPQRLSKTEIPIAARIVAVADCVDALSHNRPYRPSWPVQEVLREIRRGAGNHFDPDVVNALANTECRNRIVRSPPHPWPPVLDSASGRRSNWPQNT